MGAMNILYLILVPCAWCVVLAYHGDDLPPGPYCGLTGQCCSNRQDSCSHKILDFSDVEVKSIEEKNAGYCVCDVSPLTGNMDWICSSDPCIIDERILDEVNRGFTTWKAANYSEFYNKKLKDGIIYKLGTLPLSAETLRMYPIRYNKDIEYPRHFDSRTRWPGLISPIVDQAWCGSDWAVSIAGVASDRFAIQSNGIENMVLSPQTLVSCNTRGQQSCDGGHIDIAWNFARTHGLVDEACFPYKAAKTPCPFKRRGDLIQDGCRPVVAKRFSRYKVGTPGLLQNERDIMYDIIESGPVQAIMTVRQDFFHYRQGVYRHTNIGDTTLQGLHSVRIIGWGDDNGLPYWIVANSWGPQWGENGFFRIARGTNESGIESFVVTVLAEVTEA
ncbi:uncharacterized peptidase C1-like protein F26E4.3 [Hyposmocoma kahamanoa]|uniref:uncharacterized peptidase C1-like protein F26E4.3 n=1 Tax=Hyposmocoma kahamanoa TaxID=1477025 RepID=UPI000E6D9D7F|nr:uncharacterized peptidase C1-like protein F26E4.3 [Hyposmocoma kahamanoa]